MTGVGALVDPNFKENWWKWTLGGAAAGATIGFVGSEHFQNWALGIGFRSKEEITAAATKESMQTVEKAEKIVATEKELWKKTGTLPQSRDPSGAWTNQYKCNKFLQEAKGNFPEGTIQKVASTAKTVPGQLSKPGDVYLIPKTGYTHGHGIILGKEGSFLHASDVLGGAVETKGFARLWYKFITQFDFASPVIIP
jgi:hypothetical protein